MSYLFAGGALFIFLGIVLLTNPWQFFSRHDPIMIKVSLSKPYRGFVKVIGFILVIAGILFEVLVIIKLLD